MRISLLSGAAALALTGVCGSARAQDVSLEQLRSQLQVLQARIDALERRPQGAATAPPASAAQSAPALTTTLNGEGAARPAAGGPTLKIRGRLLLDAVSVDVDRDRGAAYEAVQFRARQLFIGAEGQTGKWAYRLEGGVANGSAWAWDDAAVEYRFDRRTSITAGNQKTASLESLTSFKGISLMERGPFAEVADLGFALAIQGLHTGPNWSVSAALQGDSVNRPDVASGAYEPNRAVERTGATARATWAPVVGVDDRLHLGAWLRRRDRGGEAGFTYAAAANTAFRPQTPAGTTLFGTGPVGDADTTLGLEAAWMRRNLSLQGEVAAIRVDRLASYQSPTYGGDDFGVVIAYALASWFPTGEVRPYKANGSFGRIKVLRPLDKGGAGALEFAARYDYADLSDLAPNGVLAPALQPGLATAGVYRGVTVGANWHPYDYLRVMANLTRAQIDNRAIGGVELDADVTVAQFRLQVEY